MRKLLLTFLISVAASTGFTYDWELFSPPGIVIVDIHFFEDESRCAAFSYDHFYLMEELGNSDWQLIDVPADGAAAFNEDTILIIIDEAYSTYDGIYILDVSTHQYNLIELCPEPNFILKQMFQDHYFVGYENGLLESHDGYVWSEVQEFSGVKCLDMARSYSQDNVYGLATDLEENNVYLTYDNGLSWEQLEFPAQFFEIAFAGGGPYSRLVAVCNGKLGGLYKFEDDNWEVLYYSLAIQALGYSSYLDPYIGWYTGMPPDIGIAGFDFNDPNAGINYVYEGLPNTNVFSIAEISIPTVGVQWVCCCTDEGAFISYGIDVGQEELHDHIEKIRLYPKPLIDKLNISVPERYNGDLKITLMDMGGKEVLKTIVCGGTNILDVNNLLPGIYIVSIQNTSGTILHSEKIIKH